MGQNRDIVNVMIIGAMKCGTTSLFDYLSQHPEICPAIVKEPEFFSEKMGLEKYKTGKYSHLFQLNDKVHKFTLDGSTGYTKFPVESGVAERIYKYGLAPKFIYMVRNPFDRIRSHYNFMLKEDEGWNAEMDSLHLINISKYFMQMEQYRKYFPKEDILVLDFDEWKSQPYQLFNRVLDFIGASEYNPQRKAKVKNKTVPTGRKKLKIKNVLKHWFGWIPQPVKNIGNSVLDTIYSKKQEQLTPDQKQRIYALLKDDMRKLKNEYGINTVKWGF